MLLRPKIFLDTDICISVADGSISPSEWRRARRAISDRYRYYISFVTLKELLIGLSRGDSKYFESGKEELRILEGPGRRQILPYPSEFALRTVLGHRSPSQQGESRDLSDEEWAEGVLKTVLAAQSKAQLKAGVPIRNGRESTHQFFDLDHFDTNESPPQRKHADLLQGIREGRINRPDPLIWAAWILRQYGLTTYERDCEKLAAALDAAYRFECALSQLTNQKYDYQAHASDDGDVLQLFYLCDPLMHFLTMNKHCVRRTEGSEQSSRVLIWRDFVQTVA